MNNMKAIMQMKEAWDTFVSNHPKFPLFLNAVKSKGVPEGTVVAVSLTYPDGSVVDTNLKVTESDLKLFETLKSLS